VRDEVVDLPTGLDLVIGPGGVLGTARYDDDASVETVVLDETGAAVAESFFIETASYGLGMGIGLGIAMPDGFAVLHNTRDVAIVVTPVADARPGAPIDVASIYEVGGCCSAGGAGGEGALLLVGLFVLLNRRGGGHRSRTRPVPRLRSLRRRA
jgi:hypothetical protein